MLLPILPAAVRNAVVASFSPLPSPSALGYAVVALDLPLVLANVFTGVWVARAGAVT